MKMGAWSVARVLRQQVEYYYFSMRPTMCVDFSYMQWLMAIDPPVCVCVCVCSHYNVDGGVS